MENILRLEHENEAMRKKIEELEVMVVTRDHMLESMQKQVDDAKFFAKSYEKLWEDSMKTIRDMSENRGVETEYIVTVGEMQRKFTNYNAAMYWFADHHKPGMVWKFSKYINGQLVF